MKKFITLLVASLCLTACVQEGYSNVNYTTPDNLKDCTFTKLTSPTAREIVVVRCPNSIVSTVQPQAKTQVNVITVDGVKEKGN